MISVPYLRDNEICWLLAISLLPGLFGNSTTSCLTSAFKSERSITVFHSLTIVGCARPESEASRGFVGRDVGDR